MINEYFLLKIIKKKIKKKINEKNLFLKLSSIRNNNVIKDFLGLKVAVYNGKFFVPFRINSNMINTKFGSFFFTKSIVLKKKKNKYFDKKKK